MIKNTQKIGDINVDKQAALDRQQHQIEKPNDQFTQQEKQLAIEKYSFLDSSEIVYDNLNQGYHEDFWYYGKMFIVNGQETEGLVTSNKKILINNSKVLKAQGENIQIGTNQIKEAGLNHRHSLEINKNFWSNSSIKLYINSSSKIDKEQVFSDNRKSIEYFMDVADSRVFDVVTCWIVGTYCYELFESYGYLYFHGLRESGKSKFKKVLRLIGFNGQEASSISEASFFRTIENTKGLLCIDEYERLDTERKKATDLLLNAGIEKGASVKRVDKVGTKQVNRGFDVYCPKVICNITGLGLVVQSRCITFRLCKTASIKGNRKPKTNDSLWQKLRDINYTFVMDYWQEIKTIYESYTSPLRNRDEDVWTPVLVIAKLLGVEDIVKAYAEENIKETQIENIENDRTYAILIELLNCPLITTETKSYHLDDLIPYLRQKLIFGDKNPERVVGWHLTNLNIFQKSRTGKGITYSLSKNQILHALISRGYPVPEEYLKSVEELHNTTLPTQTTTTTKTTYKIEKEDVVDVINVVNVVKKVQDKAVNQGRSYSNLIGAPFFNSNFSRLEVPQGGRCSSCKEWQPLYWKDLGGNLLCPPCKIKLGSNQ